MESVEPRKENIKYPVKLKKTWMGNLWISFAFMPLPKKNSIILPNPGRVMFLFVSGVERNPYFLVWRYFLTWQKLLAAKLNRKSTIGSFFGKIWQERINYRKTQKTRTITYLSGGGQWGWEFFSGLLAVFLRTKWLFHRNAHKFLCIVHALFQQCLR